MDARTWVTLLSVAATAGIIAVLGRIMDWLQRDKSPAPRDEFDEVYDRSWAAPLGIFIVWVGIVRGFRAFRSKVRRTIPRRRAREAAIQASPVVKIDGADWPRLRLPPR
jgi:hypothetical protein